MDSTVRRQTTVEGPSRGGMGVLGGVKLTGEEFCIPLKVGENEVRQYVQATEQQHANLKTKRTKYQCKNILNKTYCL